MTGDLFAVTDGAAQAAPLVVVELPGQPRGKGRPRSQVVHPKPGGKLWQRNIARGKRPDAATVLVFTDEATEAYESALKKSGARAMGSVPPYEGPLAVRVFAMMSIAPSWPNRKRDAAIAGTLFPTTTPDGDNILKVLDSLNGIVWIDDSQIVRWLLIKEYAESPGLIVEVYRLP